MTAFDLAGFESLPPEFRQRRAAELALYLSERLSHAMDFDLEVERIVRSLREQGHDLWSWDESDDFQIWGPDYQNRPSLHGLLIDFRTGSPVDVSWLEDRDPTIPRQVFGRGF